MQDQLRMQSAEVERELYLSSRRPPRNDAAVFVENHVALGPESTLAIFSERVDAFVPVEEAKRQDQEAASMWEEANDEINALFDLMAKVQAKFGGNPTASAIVAKAETQHPSTNLRNCTWNDVMAEVQEAANMWKRRPSRDSKMMGLIDKVGQNSAALEAWIQLLPVGDYGASICGVFKLAINAASQYDKIQETVIESLSEIPRLMDNATRYVQIYREMPDQSLEQRTYQLFRAILKTLRLAMQFFLDGKRKKVFGSLIKQDSYGSELSASVEEVNKCVQHVRDEAELCKARQASAHGHMLLQLHATSTATSQNIQVQTQEIVEQSGLLYDIDRRLRGQEDVLQAVYGLLRENIRLKSQLSGKALWARISSPIANFIRRYKARQGFDDSSSSQSLRAGYDAANVDHGVVDDNEELSHLSLSLSQKEEREARKAAVELLRRILQYDSEAVSRDMLRVIRDGHQLSYRAKSRGSALVNNPMFREFMTTATSSSLLVNGREDTAAADGISPLSFVVAEVLSSIGGSMAQVFPLTHFCNARRPSRLIRDDGKKPDYEPLVEMAASLVGQLLGLMEGRGIEADVPSILGEHEWRNLGKLKVKSLVKTLGALIAQLPPDSIVVCAIDDVGEYETGALSGKLQDAMRLLGRMAEGGSGGVIFKLLVTCRNRALDVGRFFSQTLEMEEDIEEDTSAEWSISQAGRW